MPRPAPALVRAIRRLGVSGAIAGGVWTLSAAASVGVHRGYAPRQPIAFSHRLHAGESRIPCLYCHFGAARSRHAGIPPVAVCMNCHAMLTKRSREIEKVREAAEHARPIGWTRVHVLPDFVSFSHHRHQLAGVECRSCHGAVESMTVVRQEAPLSMGWCIECHRARAARNPDTRSLECGRCHY